MVNMVAREKFVMCLALGLCAGLVWSETVTWNPEVSEGDFTVGASWTGGVAPAEGDTAEITSSTTVSFPTEATTFGGVLYAYGAAPDVDETREIVFDTRGTSFYYTNTLGEVSAHPFLRGWSYSGGKWTANANRIFLGMRRGDSGSAVSRLGVFKMTDALVRAVFSPTETKLVQESGTFNWNYGEQRLILLGSTQNNIALKSVFELKGGTLNAYLINLRANSRFVQTGGSFSGSLQMFPNNRNTGDGFGGGTATFLMQGGTSTSSTGKILVGQYGGSHATFEMSGTASISRSATGTLFSDEYPNLEIAAGTASNSGLGNTLDGLVRLKDSASISITGKSGFYGYLTMANVQNATATLIITNQASATFGNGSATIGSGKDAVASIVLADEGKLTFSSSINAAMTLGGAESKSVDVTVADKAILSARVITPADAAVSGITLTLDGGTVKSRIDGNGALDLVVNGGVIMARAATTEDQPLIMNLKSLTVADGAAVIIDTQTYDTYVDQDFGAGVTVVKRGSGTLYVKDSNHAKTVVEEGKIACIGEKRHFGGDWEVKAGQGVANADVLGEQDLVTVDSEASAQRLASTVYGNVARALGTGYATGVAETADGTWKVTLTETERNSAALTWSGAAGAPWDAPTSWTPNASPDHNDDLTVSSAAEIALPSFAFAKSLALTTGDALTLSGNSLLKVTDTLSVTGSGAAKDWTVPEGSSVTVRPYTYSSADAKFTKAGKGALALDYTGRSGVTRLTTGAVNVKGGVLHLKGNGGGYNEVNGRVSRGAYVYENCSVGTDAPQSGPATLVLDGLVLGRTDGTSDAVVRTGTDSTVISGDRSIVVINQGGLAGDISIGHHCMASGACKLAMTNSTMLVGAGKTVYLGNAYTDWQESCTKVVGRFGAGTVVRDCGGGNANGRFMFGAGNDIEFADGAYLLMANTPWGDERWRGAVEAYERASGSIRFVNGSYVKFACGFCMNNSAVTATAKKNLTVSFDNGSFIPTLAAYSPERAAYLECRTAIFRNPQYQGFEARAGGMNVPMDKCSRYTIAAPVRGVGALVKTGAGTLVLGRCRTMAVGSSILKDASVTEANCPYVDVVTVQNAGGVHVAEGTVELEAGATDTNSTFTVDAGCTLDLAGHVVTLGAVRGAGEVSGGTIDAIRLRALADGEAAATLKNVDVRKVFVDFAGAAADDTVRLAKLGSGVTGVLQPGGTFVARAVNCADSALRRATCVVDADGNVTATPTSAGLLLLVR